MEHSNIYNLIYGGDYIDAPATKDLAMSLLRNAVNKGRLNSSTIFLAGNHDYHAYPSGGELLTDSELYNILFNGYIGEANKLYFYKDNKKLKVRTIYLNTHVHGELDDEQITWLNGVLSSLDIDWKVLFFSHMALREDGYNVRTPAGYYQCVSQVTPLINNYNIDVICWVCGHTHIDIHSTELGFPIVTTTCDINGAMAEDYSADNRDANTINQGTFDVIQYDLTRRKIYFTRIGGGQYNAITSGNYSINDREFNF